jgi:hypothetical protein
MTRRPLVSFVFSSAILFGAAALGQTTGSASSLQQFEGSFAGQGTLARQGGASRSLTCNLTGRSTGDSLSLAGTCRAMIIASANISIETRCSGNRCTGSFRDGLGTISSLAGQRRGDTLSFLATETADSVRPDPPARMSLSRTASGITLTVRNTEPGKGSAISLDLKKQ